MTFRDYGETNFKKLIADLTERMDAVEILAREGASTGLLTGGEISINAGDNTAVDISALTGRIIDASDPGNITETFIDIPAKVAVPISKITKQLATFLAIDVNGNVVEHPEFPENGSLRREIVIGAATHTNLTSISRVSDLTAARPFQMGPTVTDLNDALKAINRSGHIASGDPAGNLSLEVTGGKFHFTGIQRNPTNPNNDNSTTLTAPTITFFWRDGAGGFLSADSATVTAGAYDNDSGGAGAPSGNLNNNQWTNHYVYYSPDLNQVFIEYGQIRYNGSGVAIAALSVERPERLPALIEVPIIAALTMRGGATDLTDLSDAEFTQANRFGFFSST